MLTRTLALLAASAIPLLAQTPAAPPPTTAVAGSRILWIEVRDYVVRAADQMPDAKYDYRPTPEVRTFGELIGHIAGSQNYYCAVALGEKPPGEDDIEKTAKTKAALVAALRESNTYCARAYAQTEAQAAMMTQGGEKQPRVFILMRNAAHDNEHYGNIVTYFRLNGMVPPSSQPRPAGGGGGR